METLVSAAEIAGAVQAVADKINRDYQGKNLLVLAVLKGSFVFLADLVRALDGDVRVEFMTASSYGNNTVAGELRLSKFPDLDWEKRHVIVVDDIFESGQTLQAILRHVHCLNPASVAACVCFIKNIERSSSYLPKYSAFEIGPRFIVGYGLDHAEQYRNLPYVAVLEESDIG